MLLDQLPQPFFLLFLPFLLPLIGGLRPLPVRAPVRHAPRLGRIVAFVLVKHGHRHNGDGWGDGWRVHLGGIRCWRLSQRLPRRRQLRLLYQGAPPSACGGEGPGGGRAQLQCLDLQQRAELRTVVRHVGGRGASAALHDDAQALVLVEPRAGGTRVLGAQLRHGQGTSETQGLFA